MSIRVELASPLGDASARRPPTRTAPGKGDSEADPMRRSPLGMSVAMAMSRALTRGAMLRGVGDPQLVRSQPAERAVDEVISGG